MDQRDGLTLPGSGSYYLHQGNADSVMGLQGSPGMNSMSNSGLHFHQSNAGRNFIGSTLPLDTSSSMSPHGMGVGPPHGLGVGPPPAMMQGEPVRRKRGRPRKYGRDSGVSLALSSPSSSTPVPFVRPSQKRRGRPPGTGRKQQQVPLGTSSSCSFLLLVCSWIHFLFLGCDLNHKASYPFEVNTLHADECFSVLSALKFRYDNVACLVSLILIIVFRMHHLTVVWVLGLIGSS